MTQDLFARIDAVAAAMRGFPAPWFFCGGWAVDLFLGEVTREHEDVEVGIFRCDQQLLGRCLRDWTFMKVVQAAGTGHWEAWTPGEELRLPIHQIAAKRRNQAPEQFHILLHEGNSDTWVMRRHPELTRPAQEIVATQANGMPYLVPEVQLLFKAKDVRAKDAADFTRALPRLSAEQRAWLENALRRFYPTHAWLPVLIETANRAPP